jgi:hypothetical protein
LLAKAVDESGAHINGARSGDAAGIAIFLQPLFEELAAEFIGRRAVEQTSSPP